MTSPAGIRPSAARKAVRQAGSDAVESVGDEVLSEGRGLKASGLVEEFAVGAVE
jgi:hypothetical protein